MSWEDIDKIKGSFIDNYSEIRDIDGGISAHYKNKNVWPTKELAEAALALSQLLQLRDAWNECNTEEEPLYNVKYSLYNSRGRATMYTADFTNYPLRFKTAELRNEFLETFKSLIETALPLL